MPRTAPFSAAKPSDFSDSVRFLKALPKTGPKRETSEKQPKCRRSFTFLCRSPVLSLFSATEGTHHCTFASKKASAWLWKCKVTCNMPGSGWMACTLTVCTESVCDHTHHYKIHDNSGVTMATKRIFMVF